MKVTARFWTNYKEIEQAEKLNINIPEPEFEWGVLLFKLFEVSLAHRDDEDNIVIYINGQNWTIKYNQELWDKLLKELG